jgi:uncharacterized membrane protein (GlpM family)
MRGHSVGAPEIPGKDVEILRFGYPLMVILPLLITVATICLYCVHAAITQRPLGKPREMLVFGVIIIVSIGVFLLIRNVWKTNWRFTFVNSAAARIWKRTPEELLDLIEASGREIDAAVAELRSSLDLGGRRTDRTHTGDQAFPEITRTESN